MKKIIALLILLSMLLVCACSKQSTNSETTASASDEQSSSEPQPTEKPVKYVSEWGSDLVPEDFPPPPEKAHDVLVSSGKANDHIYSDWIRIRFTCPEHTFYAFSNSMDEAGYTGGVKKISNGTYYSDGFKGYWQNGKHLIRISNSSAADNGETKFTFEISECQDNFPEELTEHFPKFEGFTKAQGVYCGHDADGKHETYEFSGMFDSPRWHWDFRFTDGFVGVEEAEFEAYYNLLGEEGFSGIISTSTVDGCSTISVDTIKKVNEKNYCVFLLYNQTLKTLDIAYTNDPTIYEHD